MGFVNKLRGELVDILEWLDDDRNTLVWRFPRYHNQIKNGAKLIVRPGQTAVFVEQGRIADVFKPGTYSLETKNLPVLSTIRGWKHGFDSPFKAEVYFVATRQITELKWGTPNPVIVRDPDFGPVRVRAFGTYTLRAERPEALLSELVGTDGSFEAGEIDVLLRSIISSAFADLVATSELSVVDLASHYGRLSEQLRAAVLERVDDEYGLDLPQLFIVNISVPEAVERALDARSSMGVLGDLQRYKEYQLGEAIPVAAANPAGGLAAAGVGLGMGMAFTGAGSPSSPPGMSLVPPPPPRDDSLWHVALGGRVHGPYTMAQLREALVAGQISGESLMWTAGMEAWTAAARVPQLAAMFQMPPPPPPGE
jgi:membrane protease subunit (stomatin/prohibitin family)